MAAAVPNLTTKLQIPAELAEVLVQPEAVWQAVSAELVEVAVQLMELVVETQSQPQPAQAEPTEVLEELEKQAPVIHPETRQVLQLPVVEVVEVVVLDKLDLPVEVAVLEELYLTLQVHNPHQPAVIHLF